MSHFKINPVKTLLLQHSKDCYDWQLFPHCLLSWKLESVKTACILTQFHYVYLPEQLVGEFHSQTASVFHLGSAIESLQMQMLPERKMCNPERTSAGSKRVIVPRRLCFLSAVTWHHQHLDNLQSQQHYLQLRNVRHPPSGRKWRREEPVRVTSLRKDFSSKRTDINVEAKSV